ncbi:hypothetical protein KEM52_000435, partial [Ascosphaera acerosa]
MSDAERVEMARMLMVLATPLSLFDEVLRTLMGPGNMPMQQVQQLVARRALLIRQYKQAPDPNSVQAGVPAFTAEQWSPADSFSCSLQEMRETFQTISEYWRQFRRLRAEQARNAQVAAAAAASGGAAPGLAANQALGQQQGPQSSGDQAQAQASDQAQLQTAGSAAPTTAAGTNTAAPSTIPLAASSAPVTAAVASEADKAHEIQRNPAHIPQQTLQQPHGESQSTTANIVRPAIPPAAALPSAVTRQAAEANAATNVVKQSPHGVPQYTGPSPVTRDKLVLPPAKKRKTQSAKRGKESSGPAPTTEAPIPGPSAAHTTPKPPSEAATPSPQKSSAFRGVPEQGAVPATTTTGTPSQVASPAPATVPVVVPQHFCCEHTDCPHHLRGFVDQKSLDAHVAEEHTAPEEPKPEDVADWFVESLAIGKKNVEQALAQRDSQTAEQVKLAA